MYLTIYYMCCHHESPDVGSRETFCLTESRCPVQHPEAHNTSVLLKYTLPNHQHSCDATCCTVTFDCHSFDGKVENILHLALEIHHWSWCFRCLKYFYLSSCWFLCFYLKRIFITTPYLVFLYYYLAWYVSQCSLLWYLVWYCANELDLQCCDFFLQLITSIHLCSK